MKLQSRTIAAVVLALAGVARADAGAPVGGGVDFVRDIKPLLSDNCFACHGPDAKARQAELRLDTKEGAFAARDGSAAVVAGKPDKSALIERILTADADQIMPPVKSGKKLTPAQIALLKKWVEGGAQWTEHWSFTPLAKPAVPQVADPAWNAHPVDAFVRQRLDGAGLKPMPQADRLALIRRVTLDLTGLPPTPAEVDAFLADKSPKAYGKLVDRLFKSPRYGEHMARYWLDVARFGDTHGMHLDNYREMWLYRDWVIKAYNDNLPFDRFVTEQLAGDLLPNATDDQLVATGFNRCHVTTNEGGSIYEECYVRNVFDRVETAGTVFLGLTFTCSRCHDHKYDPIKQKDFYSLFAFFNSLDGSEMDGNIARYPPILTKPTAQQKETLANLDRELAAARKTLADRIAAIKYVDPGAPEPITQGETKTEPKTKTKVKAEKAGKAEAKAKTEEPKRTEIVWIDDALPAGAKAGDSKWDFVDKPSLTGKKSLRKSGAGLIQDYFTEANPGLTVGAGDTLFAHVFIDPVEPPKAIMLQWHTAGWSHRAYWGENIIPWGTDNSPERRRMGDLPKLGEWVRLEVPVDKVGLAPGAVITGWAFTQHAGTVNWDKAGIVSGLKQGTVSLESLAAWSADARVKNGAGLPKPVADAIKVEPAKRNAAQIKTISDHFLVHVHPKFKLELTPLNKQVEELDKQRGEVDKAIPATLIFREAKQPKPAFVLKRGEYDQKADPVNRVTPGFLPPLAADLPKNRLGLAKWLLDPQHPLTARVAVNRLWQHCFGTGLVKTAEDFGSQGEPPTHAALLDWLAVQYREDGWDTKKLLRLLVTSEAYRQSAKITPEALAKDPANRLISRGPRFRLDAEMLRDQALFVSGLLVEQVGGASVKPPQPSGLWEAVGFTGSNTARFTADTGRGNVHRRSFYTFWKRTSPPPQMTTFDAPSREACTCRRERTNTPLQALLMLNETQYVECARALGERAMREGGATVEGRLDHMFRLVLSRKPDAMEAAELSAAFRDLAAGYAKDPKAAKDLIGVGETKPDAKLPADELAAWTLVAGILLNLDETVNK